MYCLRRYRAIVNPMDIQTSGAVLWTCMKAVGIWVVSVLLAIPEAIFSQVARIGSLDNGSFTACIPYPQTDELHPKIHSVLIFLVYFLIPLVIISIYYYHIAKTLIKSAHNLPGEYNEHTKKQVSSVGVYVEGMLVRSSQCYFEFLVHGLSVPGMIRTVRGHWDT